MRLGQLARNLGITTTDIVLFLSNHQITVNDHPNVKLDDATEQQVISAFSQNNPEKSSIVSAPEPTKTDDVYSEDKPALSEESLVQDAALPNKQDEAALTTEEAAEELPEPEKKPVVTSADEVEVIKAPKIELQGLKVVGKIDLPEPAQKASEKIKEASEKQVREKRNGKKQSGKRRLSDEEKEKRRIKSKKARLKREQMELQRKLELEQKQLKKQKKQHYLQKINKPAPEPKKDKVTKQDQRKKPTTTQPKTLLGKFWRWLNT